MYRLCPFFKVLCLAKIERKLYVIFSAEWKNPKSKYKSKPKK